jgi:hypothetical protein
MKPGMNLQVYLALVAGLFLTAALASPGVALVAGPPPAGTPPGVTKVPFDFPMNLLAQPASRRVGTGEMHGNRMMLREQITGDAFPPRCTGSGSGWRRIVVEDFEGTFPPPGWGLFDGSLTDGGEYFWGRRDCRAHYGNYGTWAGGGGGNGSLLPCGATYPTNLSTSLVYGPFDLSQVTGAEWQFSYWLDAAGEVGNAAAGDFFFFGASPDGAVFNGSLTTGQSGAWVPGEIDLANVPRDPDNLNLIGDPSVWAALGFASRATVPGAYEGAFVDDATLWVYEPPPSPPPLPTATLPITIHTTTADFVGGCSHDVSVSVRDEGDGALGPAVQMAGIGEWERLPSLPRALLDLAAVTARGYLFVIGGNSPVGDNDPGGGYQRRVYHATIQDDGLLGRWVETTPLPQALASHAAVVANGHLFVLGGLNNNGLHSTVSSARINDDGSLGEWDATLPPLPEPLASHAAVATHGHIYVLGGSRSFQPEIVSDAIYRARVGANGGLGEWETLSISLPLRTRRHAAVATCGHLFLVGGADEAVQWNLVYQATIQPDGSLGAWGVTALLPEVLAVHAAAAIRGGVLVTGGWRSDDPVFAAQNKVYWALLAPDCSLNSWIELAPLPYNTHNHALAATDRYVFNLGGGNAAPRHFAAVLMAPLQLNTGSVPQATFNHQFYLGDNYTIESLRWTEEGGGDVQVSLRYRVADAGTCEYGRWSDYASANPITIRAIGGFLEYQAKFEGGSGPGARLVTEVSLDVTALPPVYLPLVVKD